MRLDRYLMRQQYGINLTWPFIVENELLSTEAIAIALATSDMIASARHGRRCDTTSYDSAAKILQPRCCLINVRSIIRV